ncbi:MAG TPA: rhodanese-like domain-containing protein [Sulfuricaulis sp.]|nr:rhodanese-like domain-containing protein [Sulfuricaulis sp.]
MYQRLLALLFLSPLLAGCSPPPYTNIDNDQLKVMLEQGVPVYDVRRPEEWRETGVLAGSHLLTFVDARGVLQPDFLPRFTQAVGKDDPVILICRVGNRTNALGRYLAEELGYTRVYNVRQGIARWIGSGGPVSRP